MNHKRLEWNHSDVRWNTCQPHLQGEWSWMCLGGSASAIQALWHNCGVTCNICLLYYNFSCCMKVCALSCCKDRKSCHSWFCVSFSFHVNKKALNPTWVKSCYPVRVDLWWMDSETWLVTEKPRLARIKYFSVLVYVSTTDIWFIFFLPPPTSRSKTGRLATHVFTFSNNFYHWNLRLFCHFLGTQTHGK